MPSARIIVALPVIVVIGLLAVAPVAADPAEAPPRPGDCSPDADALDPATWDAEELASLPRSSFGELSPTPHVDTGTEGMVVGTSGPLAIRAGRKALEQCGTAIDAVLATAFAQINLALGSWVSHAGESTLLYYEAETGTITSLNGTWNAPLNPDPAGGYAAPVGRSVLVHGFMDAAGRAHERWGRLDWDDLLAPAIWLAEEGVEVDSGMANTIKIRAPFILRTEEGREIFLKDDGTLYDTGDIFTNPQLAETLRNVAEHGYRYLYEGEWAEHWVELVNREGGDVSLEDLSRYEATFAEPMRGPVRDVTYVGPALPENGGYQTLNALRAVEAANLREVGTPYTSADALAGVYNAWSNSSAEPQEGSHSDGVVAMDSHGNIAALTHSINAVSWGSTGIFVDGVSISDAGSIQQSSIGEAGPGGRVHSFMTPSMLLDEQGRPFLATSSIGSGLLELNFQRLVDVVEYGQPYAEAVFNPAFHYQGLTTINTWDPVVLAGARAQGARIIEAPYQAMAVRGYTVGLQVDRDTGVITGANGGDHNGRAEGVDR